MGFLFLTSGLFLGWSLGANHHGNIFGAAVQTKMIKFKYAALITSIFVILGSVIEGSGGSATLNRLGSVNAAAGAFSVALATAISIALMTKIKLPVSTSQAIVGAIIGWNLFAGMLTDYNSLLSIVSSWIIAPIIAAMIAFLLFQVFRSYLNHTHVHFLRLDFYNRWALIVFGAFAAYSLGANNIANVVGIFVSASPFKEIFLFNTIHITGIEQLYFWGALSIAVGVYTYSRKVMSTVGTDLYKLSPISGLIVVIASAVVLYLFGSRGLQQLLINLHLPTIPLVPISSSQAVIGAVIGVGLAQGGRNIHYNIMGKISLGWISAPALACVLTFVILFFVQNVFEQPVVNKITYIFHKHELIEIQKRGVNIDYLTEVNGREYQSARALHNVLDQMKKLSREDMLILASVSEVQRIKLDYTHLRNSLPAEALTNTQWETLKQLNDKTYKHTWQMEQALAALSPEWVYRPKTNENQFYNKDLTKKLQTLESLSRY
jgi:PiT family inorganic phosphate transporter